MHMWCISTEDLLLLCNCEEDKVLLTCHKLVCILENFNKISWKLVLKYMEQRMYYQAKPGCHLWNTYSRSICPTLFPLNVPDHIAYRTLVLNTCSTVLLMNTLSKSFKELRCQEKSGWWYLKPLLLPEFTKQLSTAPWCVVTYYLLPLNSVITWQFVLIFLSFKEWKTWSQI